MKIEKMQRLDSFIRANLGVWPCPERSILIDESWENGCVTKSKFCTRKEFEARAVELGYKVSEKEKIYLRLVIEDGRKYVVDQDGRELADVIYLSSTSVFDGTDEVTAVFYDHDEKGNVLISGGNRG